MKPSTGRMMLATASGAVREAARRCAGWFRRAQPGSAMLLREGDTRLAVVRDGRLLVESADITLSHAEFVRRALGTLPEGAWVGTIRKAGGVVMALNSRTFYGNQVPAPQSVIDAVRVAFR
ncbi:MAG TPA: hypothetical protein VF647_25390 [Longimicrobium sp.]|jgi:hypothetical protein